MHTALDDVHAAAKPLRSLQAAETIASLPTTNAILLAACAACSIAQCGAPRSRKPRAAAATAIAQGLRCWYAQMRRP